MAALSRACLDLRFAFETAHTILERLETGSSDLDETEQPNEDEPVRMILHPLQRREPVFRVRQIIGHTLLLLAIIAAPAEAAGLSKERARTAGLRFVTPYVDLLDVERTIVPIMEQPRDCRRLRSATVRCQFKAYMHDGREIQSWVTVRRQRDGLLGFRLHLDVLRQGV